VALARLLSVGLATLFLGSCLWAEEGQSVTPKPEATAPEAKTSEPQTPAAKSAEPKTSPPATEEKNVPAEAPTKMPEVVVTATRTPEDVKNIPQNVTVVTQEDIERKQALTPTEMLRETPGVYAVQVSAQGSPILRGQIGNRVLYMWDGIRINNAALFGGPNGYFNEYPVGAVDRMEVIRGPGSVQYGSDAIGGVINVLSKHGDFTDSREISGEANTIYGSANNERTETADLRISDKNYAFAGGISTQDIDRTYRAGGGEEQEPAGFRTIGGYANIAYQPLENHTLRLSWIQNERDDIDYYGSSRLNANGAPRTFGPLEQRGIVKFDYTAEDLAPPSKEFSYYAYDQFFNAQRDRNVESATAFTTTDTYTHQSTLGTGAQNVTLWGPHKFTYGLDYRSELLASSLVQRKQALPSNVVTYAVPAGNTPDGTYEAFDGFALGEFKARDFLTLSAGVRFEHDHIHSKPVPLDVIPNAGYSLADIELNEAWNPATWSFGLVYNVTSEWDLAGDIATGFRAPDYSDLLSAGSPVYSTKTASVPSPVLSPEKSITYEFGPRHHGERWSLSLTGYLTRLHDVIESEINGTVTIPGQGVYEASHNANSGFGYTTGAELAFAYNPAQDWNIFGNATYTYSQDQSINAPFRFTPPAFGTLGLHYQPHGKRWWAEGVEMFAFRLVRPAPGDEQDTGFSSDPAYGSPNTTNNPPLRGNYDIPGWAITNLRAGVTAWRDSRRTFDLTLDLNNVLDARYREAYSQQQKFAPGINAIIGGRLRF